MKIKYFYIALVSILIIISVAQIFSIPPYAGDIFAIYKSGYFTELDRENQIAIDSFINITMMSRPVYGWIFLKDMKKKYNMNIKVYNNKGYRIPAPGEIKGSVDEEVLKLLNSIKPQPASYIKNGKYYSAIPVFSENKCRFCHDDINKKNIIGAMTFERDYDAHIYYSSERVIIFSFIALVLMILLYYIVKWDPEGAIKELFDKSK